MLRLAGKEVAPADWFAEMSRLAALARWAGPQELPGLEARLAHDDVGIGECVVLIHGHPFDRTLWRPQVAALRGSFRVIAPDLRGFGESPVTPGWVSMRQFAANIENLLDGLRIPRAAIVGLSMGGLVATELTVTHAERYWALGLIATTAEPVTTQEQTLRRERANATG